MVSSSAHNGFRNSPGILVAGADGLCICVNSRWSEITRQAPEEALGDRWLNSIHPEDRERVRAEWLACAGEGREFSGQFRLDTPSGEPRIVALQSALLRSAGGVVAGHLATLEDITERNRSEADALHAQKMEALGRLAGGLAHDFANLLTLICGYTDILLNRIGPVDPLRPELEEIRKAALRGSAFTARLLTFSRRHDLEPRVLDLNMLVADMGSMLRRMIGEHIELVVHASAPLAHVKADRGQLEQVIMNLAINARDAMPQGGRVVIQTENVDLDRDPERPELEPGPYVLLRLQDTGYGMDARTLSRLSEPFFTTKDEGKGTGLGLTTVYGIVRQYRGDVRVESQVGQGTAFSIYLPRATAGVAPLPEPENTAAASRGSETILLVEDEESVRRLLKHVLLRCGYQVVEARDGVEALALYHQQPVQLLLTDIVMPRMGGRELADRLLNLQPGLKVLYVSGYADDVLVRSGALHPGACFLQKPVRPELLTARLREILDGAAPAPAETLGATPSSH